MSDEYSASRAMRALKNSFVNQETSLDLAKFIVAYKEIIK